MKKIVLVLGLMVACVVSSQAINRIENGVINSMNNENVFGHLSTYLNMDEDQAADLKNVIEATQSSLQCAAQSGDASGVWQRPCITIMRAQHVYLPPINMQSIVH